MEKQTREIAFKRTEVTRDLERVEPAVIEAHNAVNSIKKQHLVEVRSMGNPAPVIRMALESICVLLGENVTDWKSIRTVRIKVNMASLAYGPMVHCSVAQLEYAEMLNRVDPL